MTTPTTPATPAIHNPRTQPAKKLVLHRETVQHLRIRTGLRAGALSGYCG